MLFIFTLDDNNGTKFVNKRQSSDRIVANKILELANGKPIYMKTKSISFFKDSSFPVKESNFSIVDNFYNLPNDAICFAEEVVPAEILSKSEIIVYRWNRSYPSLINDRLNLNNYTKEIVDEFSGYSHEKITVEIYLRKGE